MTSVGNFARRRLDRRRLLAGSTGALASTLAGSVIAPRRANAQERSGNVAFDIFWRDKVSGSHEVAFARTERGLEVTTSAEIVLKVSFVPVFRWKKEAVEIFRDDVMISSRVWTLDDGEEFDLTTEVKDDELLITSSFDGTKTMPLGTLSDLAIWNRDIAKRDAIIDSRTGEIDDFVVTDRTEDAITFEGETVPCTRLRYQVEDGRQGALWFSQDGTWMHATLDSRGQSFVYERRA